MMKLYLSLILASLQLALLQASSLQFANIVVYGYDRSDTTGVHDGSDKLKLVSPTRGSLKAKRDTAWAECFFTSKDRLVANADNGGLVGLIRGNDLLYPDWMKNSHDLLSTKSIDEYKIGKAKAGDLVFVFIPHTRNLEVQERDFYKAFDGQSHLDQRALLVRYVRNFTNKRKDNDGDRFTLVIAEVKDYDDRVAARERPMAAIEISKEYAHNREGKVSPKVSPGRSQEGPIFVGGKGPAYGSQPSFTQGPSFSQPAPPPMQPVFVQQPHQPLQANPSFQSSRFQQTPNFSGCPYSQQQQYPSSQQAPNFAACPHLASQQQQNPPSLVSNPLNSSSSSRFPAQPQQQPPQQQPQRQLTDQERLIPQVLPGAPQFSKDPFISGQRK